MGVLLFLGIEYDDSSLETSSHSLSPQTKGELVTCFFLNSIMFVPPSAKLTGSPREIRMIRNNNK
jgi:hypothetical protein